MQNFVYLQAASGMSIFISYSMHTTQMLQDRVTQICSHVLNLINQDINKSS